ncbi:hypothetical protein CTAM01_11899 [Colletotrichum tamarilloi]|uniref:Uncharacterized protein n=1 Tax=Colletotrichum tamarilloi TaxID=1209934 RepID=A0ABQ9QWA0_9PEZI|nr:uncharacterized protein CTAM01_11899 [Colletotrichum tamarilloi]KAK1487128.1 hypothetical protein CTAM01_11899 [Colletotrichum tamarilloi]
MGCHPALHRGTETYAYAPAGRLRKPESPQIATQQSLLRFGHSVFPVHWKSSKSRRLIGKKILQSLGCQEVDCGQTTGWSENACGVGGPGGADLGRPRFPSSLKSPDVVQPTEPTTAAGTKSDLDASTLAYLLHWQRYRMMACDSASYPMRQIHATSSFLFE